MLFITYSKSISIFALAISQVHIAYCSNQNEDECTLYIAESSIPGAGLGLFTTRQIEKDEVVGEPDLTIPIVDVEFHYGSTPDWIYSAYCWEAEWPVEYFLAQEVHISSFPIGSLSNYHTYLHNIQPTSLRYKDDILFRGKDPGAGAFSYFVERNFTANRKIFPGEEIFADYGEGWLESHGLDDVPSKEDYDMLENIIKLIPKHIKRKDDAYDKGVLGLVKEIVELYDEKTGSMIPETDQELRRLSEKGIGYNTINMRTPEWIRENGQCVDHIEPGLSTIPQAGRGAFAKHFISEGELIAPLPFLHIMDKSIFEMYEVIKEDDEKYPNQESVLGHQLILNYCFGHSESTILLCPVSLAALINHKSKRSNKEECSQGPNAYYRWSEWEATTSEWLELSLEEMEEKEGRGLSFEIIALSDIHPGEEIFIDYGVEWEEAWQIHIDKWKPPSGVFVSPEHMNSIHSQIRTIDELAANPYPVNLMIACVYSEETLYEYESGNNYDENIEENNFHWSHTSISDQIKRFSVPADELDFSDPELFQYWPCKAYEANKSRDKFTVRIFQSPHEQTASWVSENIPRFVTDFPREYIRFFDRPLESDAYLTSAFRHSIMIDDSIFPEQWKNLDDDREATHM